MVKRRNPRFNPLYGGKDKKRCNAYLRNKRTDIGSRRYCRNWPTKGKERCKLHGGLSTGPRTEEGRMRSLAAMKEGRQRWIERMKEEGQKISCGRKTSKTRKNRLSITGTKVNALQVVD